MRRTGWPAKILGLAAAAAVIAGCGSSGTGTGSSNSAPASLGASFATETLGTVSNLMHTDEYVAAQEGFYAQNGLNVKIKIFESGSDVTKAMQAGTVKFGSASTTAVPAARAAGVPLKLLVGGMNDAASSLYDGPLGIIGIPTFFCVGVVPILAIIFGALGYNAASRDAAAGSGSLAILKFPDAPSLGVVCLEALSGGVYLESQEDVARYIRAFALLRAAALSAADSARLLSNLRIRGT